MGEELYEVFVRGYTTKQWGRDPAELPPSIIRRIPIRQTYDDRYFADQFQGIPIGGYTRMFENMLDHERIDVRAERRLLRARRRPGNARPADVVYTGKIDEYFDYRFGELEYRSLRFENEVLEGDFQGAAIINYTEAGVPYTRITEHKHFEFQTSAKTVITREYPAPCDRNAGAVLSDSRRGQHGPVTSAIGPRPSVPACCWADGWRRTSITTCTRSWPRPWRWPTRNSRISPAVAERLPCAPAA